MAVGIDLNYFFSWPLVLFIFATLRPTRSISKLNANMVLPREVFSRCMRLWVTNYDLSNACHTLGRPIQAYPTTNPSKPNDQSKQTPTTNPSKPNDQSNDGQSKRRPTREQASGAKYYVRTPYVWGSTHSSALCLSMDPMATEGATCASTSDGRNAITIDIWCILQPRLSTFRCDATAHQLSRCNYIVRNLSKSSTAVSLHDCYLFVHLF